MYFFISEMFPSRLSAVEKMATKADGGECFGVGGFEIERYPLIEMSKCNRGHAIAKPSATQIRPIRADIVRNHLPGGLYLSSRAISEAVRTEPKRYKNVSGKRSLSHGHTSRVSLRCRLPPYCHSGDLWAIICLYVNMDKNKF